MPKGRRGFCTLVLASLRSNCANAPGPANLLNLSNYSLTGKDYSFLYVQVLCVPTNTNTKDSESCPCVPDPYRSGENSTEWNQ